MRRKNKNSAAVWGFNQRAERNRSLPRGKRDDSMPCNNDVIREKKVDVKVYSGESRPHVTGIIATTGADQLNNAIPIIHDLVE